MSALTVVLLFRLSLAETLEQMAYERHYPELLEEIERRLPSAKSQERVRLLVLKAECLVEQRDGEGEGALKAIDPRTAPARFFRVRGQWQIQNERHELARKDFRQALRTGPQEREKLKLLLVWADMESRQGRNEEAFERLSEALQVLAGGQLPNSVWTSYYDSRYFILLRAGQKREAQDTLLLARAHMGSIDNQEGVAWSYCIEAQKYSSAGLKIKARETWETALKAAPKMKPSTLLLWGFSNAFGQEDLQEVRYFAELLEREWPAELTPFEHYHLRLLQGLLWSKLDDHSKALRYYKLVEEQASSTRRFTGRRLSISLAFHRFSPSTGSTDMELALWTQLQAMDQLKFGLPEIASFMEEKLSKLPAEEQAAWLYELGVRLLDSEPRRSAELFDQALEKVQLPYKADFLDAMASAYLRKGRTSDARPLLSALDREMMSLEPEGSYKLLRLMASEFMTQLPLQNLSLDSTRIEHSPAQVLVDQKLRSQGQVLEDVQEREMARLAESAMQWKVIDLYRAKGDLFSIQGRLAEAAAAYEMGRSIAAKRGRRTRLFDRYLAIVYQKQGLYELALRRIRDSRESYQETDETESLLYSNAVEVSLLLELGQAEAALRLSEESSRLGEDEQKRAFQFAIVRALWDLGRIAEAKKSLQSIQFPPQKSEFQAARSMMMAKILQKLQDSEGASDSLRQAWKLAQELDSLQKRTLAFVWRDLEPDSVPQELAVLLTERGEDTEQVTRLSPARFLRITDNWMTRYPEMATGILLLPQAMVARAARLTADEALVQFYVGERELLCMVGTSEGLYTQNLRVERKLLERWIQDMDEDPHAARKLGTVLLDPIESICSGRSLILLSHGALSSLAWDRVELSKGDLAQSFSWILWAGERSSRSTLSENPKFLALGGIAGAKLAASQREVLALGDTLENVLSVLTGEEATLENLRAHLPKADIVHLATHSTPESLHLSDGKLSRKDIYDLPLKQGALVVLSSCEGAKPGVQERAPVTLASSLLAAGASQVVASLDRISDQEAELFFIQFYQELEKGLSPTKALQAAKLRRRAEASKDWYKFVILGG